DLEDALVSLTADVISWILGRDLTREERGSPREPSSVLALCLARNTAQQVKMLDIGKGGMRIGFPKKLRRGEKVSLRVDIAQPNADPAAPTTTLNIDMRVRWTSYRAGIGDFNVGLRFCEPQPEPLREYVEEELN